MNRKPWQLLVLAAGLGSRFGGTKQLTGAGPSGETLLEYSLFDARRAGAVNAVMVIRREHENLIRENFLPRWEKHLPCHFAFQEINDLPGPFTPPPERTKPWGTGQAVWSARNLIERPFAVINADDFYGADAYQTVADFFANAPDTREAPGDNYALVAYPLGETLSETGTVSRGVCQLDEERNLLALKEHTQLKSNAGSNIEGVDPEGNAIQLSPNAPVSMNFIGLPPAFMGHLESSFLKFLASNKESPTAECYLPTALSETIAKGAAKVRVLQTKGNWMGMTHASDLPTIQKKLRQAHQSRQYPTPLA
jgi:hypothetical protein